MLQTGISRSWGKLSKNLKILSSLQPMCFDQGLFKFSKTQVSGLLLLEVLIPPLVDLGILAIHFAGEQDRVPYFKIFDCFKV